MDLDCLAKLIRRTPHKRRPDIVKERAFHCPLKEREKSVDREQTNTCYKEKREKERGKDRRGHILGKAEQAIYPEFL